MVAGKQIRNRTAILELLAEQRLSVLNVSSRYALLHALQTIRLTAHTNAEYWVCNIFLNTFGEDLTQLKCLCDMKGEAKNLHKLLFLDVRSAEIRHKVLLHIAQQSTTLPRLLPLRKVLSDVDDTLYASGGKFPAGVDTSYPRHTVYPGVLTFYKELDLGYDQHGVWPERKPSNLIFLSARPHVYKDKAEQKSYQLFDDLVKGEASGGECMHAMPSLLAGSLDAGFKFIRGDVRALAAKKFENFEQYVQLYPEFSHIWIGDNGQGDVITGELMKQTYGSAIAAVFIHRVQPLRATPGYDEGADERWARLGVHFFDTYPGAALIACELGLIHPAGLLRVCAAARLTFGLIEHGDDREKEQRRLELNADLAACGRFLARSGSGLPKPTPIYAECLFPPSSQVVSRYGPARVRSFRPVSGIYEVELISWRLTGGECARAYLDGSGMQWYRRGAVGGCVYTPYGSGVLVEQRSHDGIHVVALRGTPNFPPRSRLLQLSSFTEAPALLDSLKVTWGRASLLPDQIQPLAAAAGDVVQTPYGLGIMKAYYPFSGGRSIDASFAAGGGAGVTGCYHVVLSWGADAYLSDGAVKAVGAKSAKRSLCSVM
jgi:hypothetical protein